MIGKLTAVKHWGPALLAALLLATALLPGGAHGQGVYGEEEAQLAIRPLTDLDRQFMRRQRLLVDELARRRLGAACCATEAELSVLQRLLDEGWVADDQRLELQAMGIVLGDLLAAELGMDWVIYEDDKGRSRALRFAETDNYLFPVTMISRRREAGNYQPVVEIYAAAREAILPLLPPLPYQ